MKEEFEREAMLLGEDSINKLNNAYVALFGLGGVGSYTAEALARSGVGKILLVDNDKVSKSNINRQLCALQSTVGRYKVDVVAERLLDINPDIIIEKHYGFVLPENISDFSFDKFDYVIDAIDTVSAKLAIAESANNHSVPMISCMGTGNKLDPTALTVTDISKTTMCPLARVMRRELKARGVKKCKVVYSREEARTPLDLEGGKQEGRRATPGSLPFVPAAAGLLLASTVVYDLLDIK
jgi:tRNA A37 threonylcarbamoyladenosine dehydratase